MVNDLSKNGARIICGAIRRRRNSVVLFKCSLGFKLRALSSLSDNQLGGNDFVGVYNRKINYLRIQADWNETI